MKGQRVAVVTSNGEITSRLREIGEDFLNIDHATGKTALIPLSHVLALEEQ